MTYQRECATSVRPRKCGTARRQYNVWRRAPRAKTGAGRVGEIFMYRRARGARGGAWGERRVPERAEVVQKGARARLEAARSWQRAMRAEARAGIVG
jgi:hypothetical protein